MTPKIDYWEKDNEACACMESKTPCLHHRYETVYICGCGKLVSHSQGDWNDHRLHPNGINIPSYRYWHGDTVFALFDRLGGYGLLPYFDPNFQVVYRAVAEAGL